ncbi:MAG: hypothetical protein JO187_02335 [Acidobacteria bacterium]|nr:hypothetical protein [Acidobacteriaceae bacterium]MBV9608369.1 hypothetical protein [Acidobacteriota bacterium]
MARYYPGDEDRWLADRRGPATLLLSDGSVWEVGESDIEKIAHWIRYSTIEVAEVQVAGRSVYVLVNKSFNAQVAARFLGMRHELGAA